MAVKVIIKKTLKDIACTVLWGKHTLCFLATASQPDGRTLFKITYLQGWVFFFFFNKPETLFSASLSFAHSNLEIFPFFVLVSQMEEPLSKFYRYINA